MSNKYSITGRILEVMDVQEFDSGFRKREFVLDTGGEYPQQLKFELLKDDVDKIKPHHKMKPFEVHFNVRGREWDGRYFVNLVAWKLVDLNLNDASVPIDNEDGMGGEQNPPF